METSRIVEFVTIFISILYEALPFIVLGAIIAGLLEELVPQRLVAAIIPRSRVLAIGIGGFLGVLFPMCECGIIPVMRRMLRKGVPLEFLRLLHAGRPDHQRRGDAQHVCGVFGRCNNGRRASPVGSANQCRQGDRNDGVSRWSRSQRQDGSCRLLQPRPPRRPFNSAAWG